MSLYDIWLIELRLGTVRIRLGRRWQNWTGLKLRCHMMFLSRLQCYQILWETPVKTR